jgi:hypothetical protein
VPFAWWPTVQDMTMAGPPTGDPAIIRHRAGTCPAAWLLLVATLVTRLAKQFAMLLLGHPLAALLDN